jgi:hypothetical protein
MKLKKAKVIMLPTENRVPLECGLIQTYYSNGKEYLLGIARQEVEVCFYSPHSSGGSLTSPLERNFPTWKGQHLYVITDDRVKEDDWCILMNELLQIKSIDCDYILFTDRKSLRTSSIEDCKKIIATTDKSLLLYGKVDKSITRPLPQIPQAFIEKCCSNGIINEINVDYVKICKCNHWVEHSKKVDDNECTDKETYKLEVNKNNEVIIYPIKTSWTRKEVIAIIMETAQIAAYDNWNGEGVTSLDDVEDWIEKNL